MTDTGCCSADTAAVTSEMSNCLTSSISSTYLDLNLGSKKDAMDATRVHVIFNCLFQRGCEFHNLITVLEHGVVVQ